MKILRIHTFIIVADVHGTGGELNLEVPYYGMAEYFLDAAQELGYNRSDLNGRYTEGTKQRYSKNTITS